MKQLSKWFNDCRIRTKLFMGYIVLVLFPMILITIFTYSSTRTILIDRMHNDISVDLEQAEKSLNEKTNGYNAVINMLYADRYLHNYLTTDYTNKGFEDLQFYVDERFTNIYTLYPDIINISVYSTNMTLPNDNYYFYSIDEVKSQKWYQQVQEADGLMVSSGQRYAASGKVTVLFARTLNLYESGGIRNIIKIEINPEDLGNLMEKSNDSVVQILVDNNNIIITSSNMDYVGLSLEELCARLEIPLISGELQTSDKTKVLYSKETKYLGTIISIADNDNILKQAMKSSSMVIFVFIISAFVAVIAIYIYCTIINKEVHHVVFGAQEIGKGRFDYKLVDLGKDEFGVIAEAINVLGDKLQVLIKESYNKEIMRKSSELNLLQEQINPHFLYNSLSSISSLSMQGEGEKTYRAIEYLSDFYRISLNKGKQILSIKEELQLLKSYLKIQDIRFENLIHIQYELEESILYHSTIKLILQPVVENAIQHGRMDTDNPLNIIIRVFQHDMRIVFEVIDDGKGIAADRLYLLQNSLNQSEGGYGLKNVNIRIKLNYGEDYGVLIESEQGFGTKIRLEIPK